MKIRLIKLMDRLVGVAGASCLPAARPRPVSAPQSFLLIRPGGIGDAILLLPALRALKAAYPGCSIDVLAEKRNAAAFGFCSGVGTIYCYDSPSGLARVLRTSYDVVIDTEQWYRLPAVVARLTRASMLIGFATNERKRLFTHTASYLQDQYEAYSFFRLIEPLDIAAPPVIATPFLELPRAAFKSAERLLGPHSVIPFVTIFPGASAPEKQWGSDNFHELASLLAVRGIAVVIIGGEDTRAAADVVALGNDALNLAGRCSLAITAAIIGKGRALVSGDSGLLHIAAGLGTPTVSLFGPSDPRKWAPQGERHLVFSTGLPCAPCSRFGTIPPCPTRAHCLSTVTVAAVLAAVLKLLGREAE